MGAHTADMGMGKRKSEDVPRGTMPTRFILGRRDGMSCEPLQATVDAHD